MTGYLAWPDVFLLRSLYISATTQKAENSSLARILQWITCVSIASDPNKSQKNELSLFDSDDGGLAPDIPERISMV